MALNLEDLKNACFDAAQSAMWKQKPISVSVIRDLARNFFSVASERAKEIHEVGEDSEIVNRAVWYLSQVHATPPMRDDVQWFKEMLEALLEIALPNTHVAEGKPQEFLQDLRKGIVWSIRNPYSADETQ